MRSFSRPVRPRKPSASRQPEIAGADAAAAVDLHAAVVGEIAVVVAAKAADLDLADLAGRQLPSVGIDDREAMIGERPSGGADAPPLAGNRRDPAGLARAIALRDRDAEPLLEPPPFLDRERCRARGEKAQRRQVVAMRGRFGVEQDIDGGRVAGRDRHAVIAHMLEEAAGRELRRHDQGGAAIDRHQRAQKLRRRPVEGTEIVDPVVRGDSEALGGGVDIRQVLAIVQHHALGPRARARGEEDHRVVVRPGCRLRAARLVARDFGKERAGFRLVAVAERHSWHGNGGEQVVEPQSVLMKNQRRLEPREDIVELIAVHLDVDGADGRAIGHDAEIAEQVFDRVVGEQRHPVVGPDAAVVQQRGDAARDPLQRAIRDRAPVVGADDPRLGRIAKRRPGDPVLQQLRTCGEGHCANHAELLSNISISVCKRPATAERRPAEGKLPVRGPGGACKLPISWRKSWPRNPMP